MNGEAPDRPRDESIAFSWRGLPQYGARLLAGAFETMGATFPVVASRPGAPIEGMEKYLGAPIQWVEGNVPTSWAQLGHPVPKVFFQSGWSHPAFNPLGDEVLDAGGRVCLVFDNDWRGTPRQWARGSAFRLGPGRRYSAAFVPGVSGRKLARTMGFRDARIWTGLYGADESLFTSTMPLSQRPPVILYVGQYIERKGCLPFAQAFAAVSDRIPEWELHMYGHGPLESELPSHPRIKVSGFTQPEQLAGLFQNARALALPSNRESWGLVVHEACLSGCQLLLSEKIGAAGDFAVAENSVLFRPGSETDMQRAIIDLTARGDRELAIAQEQSLRKARSHGPRVFGRSVVEIYRTLLGEPTS